MLEVRGLRAGYGSVEILRGIDLDVRAGEIVAVLELEQARLARARERFDQLFMVAGEQRLIREQSQWIAPNRLRVVWQTPPTPHPPSPSHP